MYSPMSPHAKNLRKGRFSESGRIYLLTMVTVDRKSLFSDFKAARTLVVILRKHEKLDFAKTLCFVIMPDHLHWMMQLGSIRNLSETVQSMKSAVSRKLGKQVFQKGYYDQAVRRESDIRGLARYVVANPLRAGQVENIRDYPHWDAVWM